MADTTQNLNSFYTVIQNYGFSRDYQARVDEIVINSNSFTTSAASDTSKQSGLLYIKNFSLPGIKKSVASVKYKGVDVHAPGTRNFGNSKSWEVTFYVDTGYIFRNWLENRLVETAANLIKQDSVSINNIPGDWGAHGYNSYAQITVYDDSLIARKTIKVNGLFVIELPNQSYDVSGAGKLQEMKVTFGYQTWEDVLLPSRPLKINDYPGGEPGNDGVPKKPTESSSSKLFSLNNIFS